MHIRVEHNEGEIGNNYGYCVKEKTNKNTSASRFFHESKIRVLLKKTKKY